METSLKHANIAAFVGNNPINQGKILYGVKILTPQAVTGMGWPILITAVLHQKEIADQIRQMDLPNQVIFLQE